MGILEKDFCVRMHYKQSKVYLSFCYKEDSLVHSVCKEVFSIAEAFMFYQTYQRFISERGYAIALYQLCQNYNINVENLSVDEALNTVYEVQQSLKEGQL